MEKWARYEKRIVDHYLNLMERATTPNRYVSLAEYDLQYFPRILANAEQTENLWELLFDFNWLCTKLGVFDPAVLIADYDLLPDDVEMRLVQEAIRLSADFLDKDRGLLAGQLLGRLLSYQDEMPPINKLLAQAKQREGPWLRPLSSSLMPPGGPLVRTLTGHTGGINAVALAKTADNRDIIISGSEDKTVKVWDLESGQCLYTLTGHTSAINAVAVTPDGRRAISGTGHKIKIWDLEKKECIYSLGDYRPGPGAIIREGQKPIEVGVGGAKPTVAITEDGSRAVSTSAEIIKVWDLESGQCLHTLTGHTDLITSVVVTPDGRRAVSGSQDGTLRVWDLNKGECLWTLRTPRVSSSLKTGDPLWDSRAESWIVSVAHLAPDGNRAIACTSALCVMVLDLERKTCLHAWHLPRRLYGLTVLPDSVQALSHAGPALKMNRDSSFWLWNLETGEILNNFMENPDRINSVAVTPDSPYAISASGSIIRVWDLRKQSRGQVPIGHTQEVNTIVMTPDGRHAISGAGSDWTSTGQMVDLFGQADNAPSDNSIRIWNVENGDCLLTLAEQHTDRVLSLAVTPNSRYVLSHSADNTIKIWDLQSGECLHTLQSSGNVMVLTPDGHRVIFSPEKVDLKVWNIEKRIDERVLVGHTHEVNALVVTPDGRRAISASDDTTLRIWDLSLGVGNLRGKICLRTLTGHNTWVKEIAMTPDGRYIVSRSHDFALKVWNLKSYKCVHSLEGHTDWVSTMAVTPDGMHVVSGSSDKTVKVWKLATGRLVCSLEGHTNTVSAVKITPDGHHIVSRSEDTIKIWNLKSQLEEGSLAERADWIRVTPDGNYIVCGSDHATLKVWNLEDLKNENRSPIASFAVEGNLSACTLAPDGMTIIAGDALGRVHFLRLENITLGVPVVTARRFRSHHLWRFGQTKKDQQALLFICPYCQKQISVSASVIGIELPCPNCENMVRLNSFTV